MENNIFLTKPLVTATQERLLSLPWPPVMWHKISVTRRFEKAPNFSKSSPSSLQAKKGQNIYNKAQFESPKHLHQTIFETLKYLWQTMF
jgi:hypothetical protein